jgi:hypothetical protein
VVQEEEAEMSESDLPPETEEEKLHWERIMAMDQLEIDTELRIQGVDVEAFLKRTEEMIARHIPGFKIKHHPKQINSRS